MAHPLRITYPGAFYHITSPGIEQKLVYKSKRDRKKFPEYPESVSGRYGAVMKKNRFSYIDQLLKQAEATSVKS